MTIIPPKFNRILGKGEAETPVTDSTSTIYSNGMCPAYNIEILEDVGTAFAASLLDIVSDNPVSRLPLSRFKNYDGVRSEVVQTLHKSGPGTKAPKSSGAGKPPIKVKVKKTSSKLKSNQSKQNLKPALKKAISMPVKSKRNTEKKKSELSNASVKLTSKKSSLVMAKAKSSVSQVSTANSSSMRTRLGGSADVRKSVLEKKKKPMGLKSLSGLK